MVFDDVRETSLRLTRVASVTDSPGEGDFASFLSCLIAEIPWFADHPEDLAVEKTTNDALDRSVVFAFVRGSGRSCLVLTGHFDVVGTECYGGLESWAFDPLELTPRLAAELAKDGRGEAAARALRDLESGEFLAGRGLLDMKSGLAAGLAVLERFAADPFRAGNMLFLAVPDEEGSSCGMRYAAPRLLSFLKERGCEPVAAINLDSAVDQGAGEAGRAIFLGSVGKLLPFAFFLGRPAHAGAPFDGINPALLAAEFVRRIESDPEGLGEATATRDVPPPPTVLYLRETRTSYDVTMPASVFCALNVLSHHRSPVQVLGRLKTIAAGAMDEALSLLKARAAEQARRSGTSFAPPDRPPVVIDYADLAAMSPGTGQSGAANFATIPGTDPVVRTCAAVKRTLERVSSAAGIEGPAVIVGFAPPYYPCAELVPGRDDEFLAILEAEAANMAAETGQSLCTRPYFPGISDMSYLAPSDGPGQVDYFAARSPIPSPQTGRGIGCPVVNIGPWGRDYHQRLERVHAGYAFHVLPELLWRICVKTLKASRQ